MMLTMNYINRVLMSIIALFIVDKQKNHLKDLIVLISNNSPKISRPIKKRSMSDSQKIQTKERRVIIQVLEA